ncbi:MAG: fumarate hydratase C-terminal domain-containing protein [Pseudomonadota bacterium]
MAVLNPPISDEQVQKLKVRDQVQITGTIYTMRDKAHKYIVEGGELPFDLNGGVIFHCGPIISPSPIEAVRKCINVGVGPCADPLKPGQPQGAAPTKSKTCCFQTASLSCRVIAAGPTTSMRMEDFEADVIERLRIKAIIGKGGMGERTTKACKDFGCLYLQVTGGAAQLIASHIVAVKGVYFLKEFGTADAIWVLEVKNLPTIVTIDSHGNNLHEKIKSLSSKKLKNLLRNKITNHKEN